MYKVLIFSAFTMSTSALYASELSTNLQIRQACAKVKQYGALGKKNYEQKQYAKALELFKKQASWSAFCLLNSEESGVKLSNQDVAIANNNVGITYAKLGQNQWARAWFLRDENIKSSQFNLSKLPPPKAYSDLSGTYVSRSGFGQWDYIRVQKNKNRYDIHYEGTYYGIYGLISGPNTGEFDTVMSAQSTKATYTFEDCKIELNFRFNPQFGTTIQVTEQAQEYGSCGFGHNVSAEGTYLKVESPN